MGLYELEGVTKIQKEKISYPKFLMNLRGPAVGKGSVGGIEGEIPATHKHNDNHGKLIAI